MKRKLLLISSAFVIAIAACAIVSMSFESKSLPILLDRNLEALTQNEDGQTIKVQTRNTGTVERVIGRECLKQPGDIIGMDMIDYECVDFEICYGEGNIECTPRFETTLKWTNDWCIH